MSDQQAVKTVLDAVRQVNKEFVAERIIYLGGAAAAIGLLSYAAFQMIQAQTLTGQQAALLFGSGGVFALTGWRAIYFFDRAYKMIEGVVPRRPNPDPGP